MIRNIITASFITLAALAVTAHAEGGQGGRYTPEQKKAWCDANPEKCEAVKRKAEDWKKKCDDNPQKCEEVKARAAEWKQKCEADPKACAEKKAEIRERIKERRAQRAPAGER